MTPEQNAWFGGRRKSDSGFGCGTDVRRAIALVWVVAAVWVLHIAANSAAAVQRPNLLVILTDDQSHRTVSAYEEAYPWVRTPQLDRLAAKGVRFRSAYMGTWCMPSRLTFLTGRLPHAVKSYRMTGKYPGVEYDPEQARFWPRELRRSGYSTAQIGKWHTGEDTGYGREWDYQASWSRPAPKVLGETTDSYFWDQEISFNGAPAREVKGYASDNYTQWGVEYIQGRHRDMTKPWFLWLCYTAPHHPYTPAARHLDDYTSAQVEPPADIYPPRPGKPAYMQAIRSWVPGSDGQPRLVKPEGPSLRDSVIRYHQTVSAVDEGVGRLLAALEETGQLKNTLVVFTSDQGYAWGQHGFDLKVAPYDANLRAPLILSQPGTLPEGAVVETPAGGADLVATLLAAAGVSPPWSMHGRDLGVLLHNADAEPDRPVLISYTGWTFGEDTASIPTNGRDTHPGGVPWYAAIRQGRLKYIRSFVAHEIEELYDIQADPEELRNLALEAAYTDTVRRLRETTVAELRRTEAPFWDRLPPVGMRVELAPKSGRPHPGRR